MDIYRPEVPTLGNEENADQAPQNPGADTSIEDNGNLIVNQAVGETTERPQAYGAVDAEDGIFTEKHPSNPGETASPVYNDTRRSPFKAIALAQLE